MSDARERLIEAGSPDSKKDGWGLMKRGLAADCLDAFLASPDDLLAVLVEAGILERLNTMADDQTPYYRRIEGEKP